MNPLKLFENSKFKIAAGAALFSFALLFGALDFTVVSAVLYIAALLVCGIEVFIDAVKGIAGGDFLDEKFLMSIASLGALVLGEMSEAVAVMLFFAIGEAFEHKAVRASRNKIRALMDICPDVATVLVNGEEKEIDAEDVEAGDIIIIKSGERVPADAIVTLGTADVDTSALTGESIPRSVSVGDKIESGSIVIGGVLQCEAIRPASESSAARILELVENADERKAREESFITSFARVYTPIVVSLALLLAVLPSAFGLTEWSDSVYRALVFLVVSCPCALVISVPLAFFSGIGAMASRGILFKGGSFFSPLAKAKNAVFDKTGTLTTGKFEVSGIFCNAVSEEELISLASSVEYASNHPIALAIRAYSKKSYDAYNISEFAGLGTVGEVNGSIISVGNERLMRKLSIEITDIEYPKSEAVVFVGRDGNLIGVIAVSDEIKQEAPIALKRLAECGINRTVMLTGDKRERAEEIASALAFDEVKSELLPENKLAEFEKIIAQSSGKTIYVGDGINDAPSITLADVGISMGAIGSDSAVECADVVIMSDNLERIPDAIGCARKTLRIARENIALALGIKIGVLLLSSFGLANMWLAVFADVGVAVLAILNSMRMIFFKGDLARKDN